MYAAEGMFKGSHHLPSASPGIAIVDVGSEVEHIKGGRDDHKRRKPCISEPVIVNLISKQPPERLFL